jgi:hypothetical protein
VSPMPNPLGEAELAPQPAQALDQSRYPVIAAPADDEALDLQRLESSLQWLRRECATLETITVDVAARPQDQPQRLPRAQQLAPIPGLAELSAELRRTAPLQAAPGIDLPPPEARDRLMTPPPRQQALTGREAIYILLAAVIAGWIGYHLASDGGLLAALSPAQAASNGG